MRFGKADELFSLLLFGLEKLSRPSFGVYRKSFDDFLVQNNYKRSFYHLCDQKLLDRGADGTFHVSHKGRIRFLEQQDPEHWWNRDWDGIWRCAHFDVPVKRRHKRRRLLSDLRRHRFGKFQKSAWVRPDPVDSRLIQRWKSWPRLGSLMILESRPHSIFTDSEIVEETWNFESINQQYAIYIQFAREGLRLSRSSHASFRGFGQWLQEENSEWVDILAVDPLLPNKLLPPGYLGKTAWQLRREVLSTFFESITES